MERGKMYLVDGHALIFKMYYAFAGNPIINSRGENMSILFGFTKYLLELLEKENPSHIAVCFDPPGGSFRNQLYPDYKANRKETPQLIIDALEPLTKILSAMNISVIMIPGYEADDVIGSAAIRFANEGFEVFMVTPDKDFGQLVNEKIYQFKPGKGHNEKEILGVEQICEKWGIQRTSQVIDVLAICGDISDNVPGVQGVGPKGASKLLMKYGSLENIYAHISELSARQQEMFNAAKDHIALSKELVTIKTDIDINKTAESLKFNLIYSKELTFLLNKYEFPSIKRLIVKLGGYSQNGIATDNTCLAMTKATGLPRHSVPRNDESNGIATDTTCPRNDNRIAIKINSEQNLVVAWGENNYLIDNPKVFSNILSDEGITKIGYGLKTIAQSLYHNYGIILKGHFEDIELMHYLINPECSHKLNSLIFSYLGIMLEDEENAAPLSLFDETPKDNLQDNDIRQTLCLISLSDKLSNELSSLSLINLYNSIEEPLIHTLINMEQIGVKIDNNALLEYAHSLRNALLEKERFIKEIAKQDDLNIASPKQLGIVIFEKLKLDPNAKKPRNGNWPTDEATLKELADRSPIIDAILEYRGLRKLLSTYIEPLGGYISHIDHRVHTTFNQALTATGRLSSSNPNLQNIPIRSENGRLIRKAFVAENADSVIMSADYSQIELRIMAHLCGDEHLAQAFNSGIDVHSATAAKIFKIDISEVTTDQRRIAKTANFGIMYGISAFGLSQRLNCSRSEAKQIIDDYFESFPSIRSFIDSTINFARSNCYVQTLFARRRYLPDINSSNANLRSFAERNAVNAPIQGSAADIIKLAMISVERRLQQENLRSRIVLQIHDELLLEVPNNEIDRAKSLLVEEMENVVKLSIPLSVECSYGENWLEAH